MTGRGARAVRVNVEELLGGSARRRRAFEERSDSLEAAALIRDLRTRARLSQKELAERLGTHQSHISEIEGGQGPQGPTFAMLKRIARACGQPVMIVRQSDWLDKESRTPLAGQRDSINRAKGNLFQSVVNKHAASTLNKRVYWLSFSLSDLNAFIDKGAEKEEGGKSALLLDWPAHLVKIENMFHSWDAAPLDKNEPQSVEDWLKKPQHSTGSVHPVGEVDIGHV